MEKEDSKSWGGGAVYNTVRVSEEHSVGWTALSLSLEKMSDRALSLQL